MSIAELRSKRCSYTLRTLVRPFLGSRNTHKDLTGSKGLCSALNLLEQHLELQEYLEHSEPHTLTFSVEEKLEISTDSEEIHRWSFPHLNHLALLALALLALAIAASFSITVH